MEIASTWSIVNKVVTLIFIDIIYSRNLKEVITIYTIVIKDSAKNPVDFLSSVNLMEDSLRTSIGYVSPQDLFNIYAKKFQEKYGVEWDYSAAKIAEKTHV